MHEKIFRRNEVDSLREYSIKCAVSKQRLAVGTPHVVADTIDYLTAKFIFLGWDGFEKVAHFAKCDKVYDIMLVNDEITEDMHLNLSEGTWSLYLSGTKGSTRITTEVKHFKVLPTGAMNGEPLPEVPLSIAEQLLMLAARAEALAQKLQEDADAGRFDGYTPIKGLDYFTDAEIAEFKEEVTPKKGVDYFDGEDGTVDQGEVEEYVRGYLHNNPDVFPVTSVNGQGGDVMLNIPPAYDDTELRGILDQLGASIEILRLFGNATRSYAEQVKVVADYARGAANDAVGIATEANYRVQSVKTVADAAKAIADSAKALIDGLNDSIDSLELRKLEWAQPPEDREIPISNQGYYVEGSGFTLEGTLDGAEKQNLIAAINEALSTAIELANDAYNDASQEARTADAKAQSALTKVGNLEETKLEFEGPSQYFKEIVVTGQGDNGVLPSGYTLSGALSTEEKVNLVGAVNEVASEATTKMVRYVIKLVQNGSSYSIQEYSSGKAISFTELTEALKDTSKYVVCVYGNSKLRPQYVSTSEIVFTGLNRDSTGADVLRMIVRPAGVQYDVFPIASETSLDRVYTKPADGIPEADLSRDVRDKLNSGGGSLPADAFLARRVSCQSVEELYDLVPDSGELEEPIITSLFIPDGFNVTFFYDEGHGLDQWLSGHCTAVRYGDAIYLAAYDNGQAITFAPDPDEPDEYACNDMFTLDGFGMLEGIQLDDYLDEIDERISALEEGGGGSGNGFFNVNLIVESSNGGHADKTLEEVVNAFQSGLIPIAKTNYNVYQFVNYYWGQGTAMARFADNFANTIVMYGNDDGTAWKYDPLTYMDLEYTPIGTFVSKKLAELDGSGVYY